MLRYLTILLSICTSFGDGKGEGKMPYPRGLLIRFNAVFVSHNHCILVYQLDGKFVSRIGSKVNVEFQFNYPCGLSTDVSKMIFIFVIVVTIEFRLSLKNFNTSLNFGNDTLHYPRDINSTKTISLS